MQNPISSYEMDGVIEIGGGGCSYVCIRKKSVSSYVRDGVMKQCWLHATCGRLSNVYKLVEGLRSLKVGVDHMVVHDSMFIHAGIMDRDIQNDLYTIMLWLSFTLNMENRGCLVIICKCGGILDACDGWPNGGIWICWIWTWWGRLIWFERMQIHGMFQLLRKCSIKSIKRRIHG